MTSGEFVLETHELTKHYGPKVGCEHISLTVRRGHVFGFLGPNGAGKSTFVKMMVGLITPTSGEATLLGRPLENVSARAKVGFLPENFRYQDWLTPRELLSFHGRLLGMESSVVAGAIPRVLELVGLPDDIDSKVRAMSKGMQQRLGLASALLGEPELLFLDEPTSALDPIGRHDVREILLHLKSQGVSVFLNSHLLSEVESVCDEVAVVDHGRVLETGSLVDLLSGPCEVEVAVFEPVPETVVALAAVDLGGVVRSHDPLLLVVGLSDESRIPDLVSRLVDAGVRIVGVTRRRRTLEALFLETVAEASREEVAHV
ncbi:MAG: ABC transporter ATP-binding protein [Coriobacteriia bacterium]|nr:ABC transporter ATP-binding protein [Coriobacteriia bacterium]